MQPHISHFTVFASAQSSKVLGCLRGEVGEQLEDDAASLGGSDLDIHVDLWVGFVAHLL